MSRTISLWLLWMAVLYGPFDGMASAQGRSGLEIASTMEAALVEAIARAEPSVVAIARVRKQTPGEAIDFEFRPDPFGRRAVPSAASQPGDPDFMPDAFATGVVVDRRGMILTAYHVLGEESEYYVTTHNRKVYRASIKGADPRSDLAVLSIQATNLVPITFGDAATLRKGQIVVALGNPYAIARDGQVSASWGIVANLARKAPAQPEESDPTGKSTLHHFGTLIQTDAKLNLGTSGGALVNLRGEMVGLTTSLAAMAGYEQAAGYAFPVDDTFSRVVDTLKRGREVEYGFLGIQPANLLVAETLGGLDGTRVDRVIPGTPAERQGVRPGDIVTAVNGTSIHTADGLVREVGRLPVESDVRLSLLRNRREFDVTVTLTKYPVRGKKIITTPAPSWRGMRIDYPSALIASEAMGSLDSPFLGEGVVVIDVDEESLSHEAGLKPGMLITHVGSRAVRTPREFREAIGGQVGPVGLRLIDPTNESPRRVVVPG